MGLKLYTVHDAPAGKASRLDAAEAELVPEGFSWGALLLGPFWLAWHGLWLALAGWIVVEIVAAGMGRLLALDAAHQGVAGLVLLAALGIFGNDIRRWTLERRGRPARDVVSGRDLDSARLRLDERRLAA